MFKWIVLAFCVVNPLFYSYQVESRIAQEFCFQASGLLLIMSGMMFGNRSVSPKVERNFNISLFAFFAWAMYEFLMYKEGFPVLLNIFIGLGVYLTMIRCLEKKDIEFVIKGVLWVTVFAIWYLALQFFGFDIRNQQLRTVGGIPHVSFFALEACYGMYLAMTLPLLLGISKINNIEIEFGKKAYLKNLVKFLLVGAFIVLLLVACWPSNSTGVFIGLVVAILAYLWYKRRVFFWLISIPALTVALCFIFLFDSPMGMQGTRIDMWKKVIQDSHLKPLGYGLDSFRGDQKEGATRYYKYVFNNTTERIRKVGENWILQNGVPQEFIQRVNEGKSPLDFWDNTHNLYIQILYEIGFPAIIIMGFILYFFVMIFRFCRKNPLDVALFCSILAILICSLVQFPLYLARNGHLIPIVLGMFIISVREDDIRT